MQTEAKIVILPVGEFTVIGWCGRSGAGAGHAEHQVQRAPDEHAQARHCDDGRQASARHKARPPQSLDMRPQPDHLRVARERVHQRSVTPYSARFLTE